MKDVLSLGLGVQSTALYYKSAMGEIPRIDYAVFADTGREKSATMRYLEFLLKWKDQHNGPEIIVKQDKNLFSDLLNQRNSYGRRYASIPAFTMSENGRDGMLRRQCTGEYKIQVVDKAIREVYGLKKHERNIPTNIWKGISMEEANRMSIPEAAWKNFIYPFTGYAIPGKGKWYKLQESLYHPNDRSSLITWYRTNGLPIPAKSSCVFCPYTDDASWLEMKEHEPSDFEDACLVDDSIRSMKKQGVDSPVFIHRSLKPLRDVEFDPNNKIPFGECSGNCHI